MKFSQIALIAAALAWPAAAAVAADPVVAESSENTANLLIKRASPRNCGTGQIADDCLQWCGCAGKKAKRFFCQDNDAVDEKTCKDIGCTCK